MVSNQWLLAAEADQIQDFIFRSSRLREVVGGSQLLTRFCAKVPDLLLGAKQAKEAVIVKDGGSFRVLFDSREDAITFGDELAEVYRRATDGALSIAQPVEIINDDFIQASQGAEVYLREAKRRRMSGTSSIHMPYIAYCASCGVGLAITYEKQQADDQRGQYICQACRNKGLERKDNQDDYFFAPFLELVAPHSDKLIWPGKEPRKDTKERDPTEDVADYDDRRYVAYLLADGNDMGKVFGQCNRENMGKLSVELTKTLRQCLADTTTILKTHVTDTLKAEKKAEVDVPVLPLILGGDDLFVLLPAPWAIHFAAEFCRQYEQQVTDLVDHLNLPDAQDIPRTMTCGAVVVICKNTHPYRLAHQAGEQRLKRAKRLSKILATKTQPMALHSVIDFEIIIGSQLVQADGTKQFRSTLRPYWVGNPPDEWGLSIEKLTEARYALRNLPGKRRSQLRDLYQADRLPRDNTPPDDWQAEKEELFQRIDRSTNQQELTTTLRQLDGEGFYAINRPTDEKRWKGSAVADMLHAWNYLLKINTPRADYEEF